MAGHSKWHNIRFRKQAQDYKKSQTFHKYSKELRSLARIDNNLETNHKLRSFIQLCKNKNVPNNIIEQALKTKEKPGNKFIYQAMVNKYAFIIESYSDNKNRTSSNLKSLLSKYNGQLQNCDYLFKRTNMIKCTFNLDDIISYIDDFTDDYIECNDSNFSLVINKVTNIEEIFSGYIAHDIIECNDDMINLFDSLNNNEDVEQVYCNFVNK